MTVTQVDQEEDSAEAFMRWLMMPGLPDVALAFHQMVHRPDWQAEAACRGQGSAGWVSETDTTLYEKQKAVCAGCPVREACLAYALANKSLKGCWGGTSEAERRELRRRRAA